MTLCDATAENGANQIDEQTDLQTKEWTVRLGSLNDQTLLSTYLQWMAQHFL